MIRIAFCIGLVYLFSACQESPTLTEEENKKVAADVRQMLHNYDEDVRKNGLSAEFKYLDNSPDFFWVPPGYTSSLDYDSVVIIIKQNAALFSLVDNRWDTLDVYPLSPELASFTGKIKSHLQEFTGSEMNFTLIETGVAIKRKDGWKILNGQTAVLEEQHSY